MKESLLYEQIVKELRRRIDAGEILPGEKVPSIALLCRDFQVSTVTALRALRELTAAGYLTNLAGRGYFAAKPAVVRPKRNLCVGCLLRSNYVSLTDHYFNDIVSGIQEQAALARVDLLWSHLAANLCNLQRNLDQELVESALEMNDRVDGFLLDERVPDGVVKEILSKTGKPGVIVNRGTALPVYHVVPNYRENIRKLMGTLLRMQYNRFVFVLSGMRNYAQQAKERAFEEAVAEFGVEVENCRFLTDCAKVSWDDAYSRLRQGLGELSPGKVVVVFTVDELARESVNRLLADGIAVPEAVGVVATDGLAVTASSKPEITTLKIDLVKMGALAVNMLLDEINGNHAQLRQSGLITADLVLGETL